jgi:hypothetical protein
LLGGLAVGTGYTPTKIQVICANDGAIGKNHGSLKNILQFPDIAIEAVMLQ